MKNAIIIILVICLVGSVWYNISQASKVSTLNEELKFKTEDFEEQKRLTEAQRKECGECLHQLDVALKEAARSKEDAINLMIKYEGDKKK